MSDVSERLSHVYRNAAAALPLDHDGSEGLAAVKQRAFTRSNTASRRRRLSRGVWVVIPAAVLLVGGAAAAANKPDVSSMLNRAFNHVSVTKPTTATAPTGGVLPHNTVATIGQADGSQVVVAVSEQQDAATGFCVAMLTINPDGTDGGSATACGGGGKDPSISRAGTVSIGWLPTSGVSSVAVATSGGSAPISARVVGHVFAVPASSVKPGGTYLIHAFSGSRSLGTWSVRASQ